MSLNNSDLRKTYPMFRSGFLRGSRVKVALKCERKVFQWFRLPQPPDRRSRRSRLKPNVGPKKTTRANEILAEQMTLREVQS
jgi:hypothetical protein